MYVCMIMYVYIFILEHIYWNPIDPYFGAFDPYTGGFSSNIQYKKTFGF